MFPAGAYVLSPKWFEDLAYYMSQQHSSLQSPNVQRQAHINAIVLLPPAPYVAVGNRTGVKCCSA